MQYLELQYKKATVAIDKQCLHPTSGIIRLTNSPLVQSYQFLSTDKSTFCVTFSHADVLCRWPYIKDINKQVCNTQTFNLKQNIKVATPYHSGTNQRR